MKRREPLNYWRIRECQRADRYDTLLRKVYLTGSTDRVDRVVYAGDFFDTIRFPVGIAHNQRPFRGQ